MTVGQFRFKIVGMAVEVLLSLNKIIKEIWILADLARLSMCCCGVNRINGLLTLADFSMFIVFNAI